MSSRCSQELTTPSKFDMTTSVEERGSQYWLRRAVRTGAPGLEGPILRALGAEGEMIVWKSPLEVDEYREARDGSALAQLNVTLERHALSEFWPRRGPVWDALAIAGGTHRLLIEAKAHIPELISGDSKAAGESRELIEKTLEAVRRELAPRSKQDWSASPFFQYANRLAFLHLLRSMNEVPAHLVFVYFTNDSMMSGPETEAEWRGAIRLMEASLGLSAHKLSPFVHKVFVDVRSL